MNPTTPITPSDRTRAVSRLRALTIRTTLAGIAAVGGFGLLAALTYAGNKTATTAVTSTPSTSNSNSSTSNSSTSNSTAATPSPTLQAATSAPTTSTSRAHVTTGGSG